jgi:hypothetical protein
MYVTPGQRRSAWGIVRRPSLIFSLDRVPSVVSQICTDSDCTVTAGGGKSREHSGCNDSVIQVSHASASNRGKYRCLPRPNVSKFPNIPRSFRPPPTIPPKMRRRHAVNMHTRPESPTRTPSLPGRPGSIRQQRDEMCVEVGHVAVMAACHPSLQPVYAASIRLACTVERIQYP